MRAPSSTAWPTKCLISQEEMWGNLRSGIPCRIGCAAGDALADASSAARICAWRQTSTSLTHAADLERLTQRGKQLSAGRGRRAHNRSARGVHADSEHRPRPPGGERSRVVSRS